MWSASTSVALLGAFGLFLLSTANLTKKYQYFATLDELGSYKLYWSVDRTDESISFAVEVRTTGWVGFGISSGNGKMKGSDLVIGWVKDCKGYLTDRYAEDYSVPVLDKRQDYELTGFSENDGTTILKFKRKLNTCDDQDRKIQEGTSKLVFAYHPHDPHSPMDLLQHSVRGQRSVMLLNSLPGSMPTDAKHFDLRVDKVKVPESDTTYWCEAVKLPKFDKKYHIVKVKPLVQRGHEGLVHHIVMFNCKSTFNESALFFRGPCEHPNMPNDYKDCQLEDLSVAWAVGSEGFTFPNEAGMPIGGEDGTRFMMFEVHYDNPLKKAGFVDSSGIRFFYTEPRKYDAGTLYTGRYSSEAGMIIPPKQKNWVATGYCSKHCTTLGLADTGLPQGGIKVFAVLLHAHLTGRKLKTKLIREGKEVQTIAQDDNFDFNFQETQYLPKEVRLFPGDELITECVYDTMERTNQTLGGLSTRDEMCLSFLWYYPLSNLVGCTAQDADVPVKIRKEFVHNNATKWPLIWNTTIVDKLRKLYDQPPNVTSKCPSSIPKRLPLWLKVPKPIITSPLPKPNLTCVASAKNTTTHLDPGAVYCKSRTGRLGTNYVTVVLGIWFIVAAMSVLQMR